MQAKNKENGEVVEFNYDGTKEKVLITRRLNIVEKKIKYGRSYKHHIGQDCRVMSASLFNNRYKIIK